MARFRYRALDPAGKKVNGAVEGRDVLSVGETLRATGLLPLQIDEEGAPATAAARPQRKGGGRVPMSGVLGFTEQLRALLVAGLPLDRSLKVLLGTTESPALKSVVQGLYLEIEKGRTLADAFSEYPRVFPGVYVNMIRAGEEGGVLQLVLERLIEFYERTLEFRNFLITSSVYPVLLLVFGIFSLIILAVVVVPKFGDIFGDTGRQLPAAAAALIGFSDFLVNYGVALLIGVAVAGVSFYTYIRSPAGREWWHRLLMRMPLIGKLLLKIHLARVTRTLGTLLGSGVPILTSIRIVQGLTDNIPLRKAIDRLHQAAKEGKGLAQPLRNDQFFPPLLGHLATVGEESGALDKMLLKVADQYDAEVRKATKSFVALFEPAMIVTMGLLIGAIVVSMLTAIFSINDMKM